MLERVNESTRVFQFPPITFFIFCSVDVNDEILAGHTLKYEDFQVKYLDKLKTQSNTICLFLQDKVRPRV